ncbi:MAG TPA: HlyD family efflux transporter periplasmic adaptor subunit [Planctomycetota bacterium]|nr:HlyD family efflux transporter periplasmic adaptor subunit [Planctomycetota bacterium]
MRSLPRIDRPLLPLAAVLAACGGAGGEKPEDLKIAVRRSDLAVTIVEGGSIESEAPGKIFNEIEGQATILKLIPEGSIVKKDDVLCELDVSALEDRLVQQKIQVQQAEAAKVRADNEYEIVRKQQESLVAQAELEVAFAELDREKYLQGDYVQMRQSVEGEQTLAKAEIARAQDKLDWSLKLEGKGFITRTDLEADRLEAKRKEIDLSLADRKLEVLDKYTFKKESTRLEAELLEAKRELERDRARAASAIAQSEADKGSKASTFDLEVSKQHKLEIQIAKGKILAPQAGLVVYAREGGGMRGSDRPIEEGAQVRERQAILSIPDLNRMMARVSIHESSIDRIRGGQPAVVRVQAFPNEPFPAVVSKVAGVPDSQNMWMNPDLKVYTTEVRLLRQDPERLRPGISCSVEIHVGDLKDVLAVPLQAVRDNGIDHFCFVEEGGAPALREVEVGLHNDKLIEVKSGLKEGDVVYLTFDKAPPLPAPRELAPSAGPPPAGTGASPAPGSANPAAQEGRANPADEGGEAASRPHRGGRGNLTEEERQKMRERFEAMSPEEREAFRQRRGESRGGGSSPRPEDGGSSPRR